MNKKFRYHPAFRNPLILRARKEQLNNDLEGYIVRQEQENDKITTDYLPCVLKIYSKSEIAFLPIVEEGFDNVCYNFVVPVCKYFGKRLYHYISQQLSIIDKNSFQNCVVDNLLNEVFNIVRKSLWLEYQEFVLSIPDEQNDLSENEVNEIFINRFSNQDNIKIFFSKYLILCKLICDFSDIWLHKHQLIFDFLSHDIISLCSYFNISFDIDKSIEIKKITISGDNHDRDNFVTIIEFINTNKIVLKNRTSKPELILNKAIDFLNSKQISLKRNKIKESENHYWTEFVENRECNDETQFAEYYERIGNLTALLYILNAQDMHYENIIADGTFPVIVDAECLFSSHTDSGYENNILNIGMLPADHQVGEKEFWIGGIDNASEQNALLKYWNVDENYQVKEDDGKFKNAYNSPHLLSGLKPNVLDFIDNIEIGFCAVYNIIMKNTIEFMSIIESELPMRVRYLFRPTYSYSHLLHQSLFPNYLESSLTYNWVFEWLWVNEEVNPKYNSLILYEQEMLKQRLIPYFYSLTNSKDLYATGSVLAAANFFEQTAEESFLKKISSLSDEDKNIQLEILRLQFQKLSSKNDIQLTSEDFILQVVNEIRKRLFPVMNTIESFDFIDGDVKKVEIDLYAGYAGYLFFLIYYRHINEDNSVDDLIETLYKKILFEIKNNEDRYGVGAYIGLSGCLFTFTNLYSLDAKSEHLESIFFIQDIIQKKISNFNHSSGYDILSGISGCIICLDHFNKIVPNQKTEKLIINCSEILLNNYIVVSDNSIGWASKMGIPLVGYSHGSSGIGHALLIAYQITKEEKYNNLFHRCLMFEKEHYNNEKKVWEDEREDVFNIINTSWCNGTTGIGLARLFFQKYSKSFNFKKEIESTLKINIQYGITVNDVLCHGNSGTLEFLLSYYQINNDEKTMDYIKQITSFLLQKIDNNDIKCNNKNNMLSLSFMTGLSGIAYELLRIKNPRLTPSPLFFHYSAIDRQ